MIEMQMRAQHDVDVVRAHARRRETVDEIVCHRRTWHDMRPKAGVDQDIEPVAAHQ
jgi:hypothetical protein